ncbi:carboxylesterase [Colletotrichum musicola]|uniref:Carboxylesterase n=1 Tax=Colletotrichum musicola TaxID=2175873 RepID=A0A8H6NGV8_9PEZI|nr:carboxylesterase [Colletotrichum musicola]
MASPHEIQHPAIGTVKGKASDGVAQFLGIKYAALDNWLDNAKLVQYHKAGLMADQYGPQTISNPDGIRTARLVIQKDLPAAQFPGLSGTECLHLNLTAPLEAPGSSSLPVLVFIHGGGFVTGSNWWPHYDMKRIVQLSAAKGKPIVAININYRLGAPGFLTSEDLRKHGFESNRGHHDQRLALQWVRTYVSGFGGDPEKTTVVGESVGGVSASCLLHSKDPFAARIVVLGGSPPGFPPMPTETAEKSYLGVLKALGAEGASAEGRIEALLRASPEILLGQLDKAAQFMPVMDGDTVPYVPTFELAGSKKMVPENASCKAAMVGYATLDGHIFALMGLLQRKKGIAASFAESVSSSLASNPEVAARLLSTYDIGETKTDDEAFINVLKFASDIFFQAPALSFATNFPGDSFLLEFAEENPWEGPFKGHSTHVLDVAFLFQNFSEHLSPTQRASAVRFAEDLVDFVNGEAPWRRVQDVGGLAVYANGTREYKEGSHTVTARYDCLVKLGEIVGMDALLAAWSNLGSTLVGLELPLVVQFRGIPYGKVPARFASPENADRLGSELDCSRFGPRCPQVPVDVGHLLRLPPGHGLPKEPEDEFGCLNLDVTVPRGTFSAGLPVLVWIHGGSQAVTFGSAASGVCDMTKLVEDSSDLERPIVAVTVQYRLNIFAFGDDDSPANLALRDQALALEWVQRHISGFGGDPTRVTLAGESAGAVYCHAHVVSKAPIPQCILSSGSLYLSPPQPQAKAVAMRRAVRDRVRELGGSDLSTAPAEILVQAQEKAGIRSWFLQAEPNLEGWEEKTGKVKRLMISDVQNESVIWRDGIWAMEAADITSAFDLAGPSSDDLKRLYNIYPDRPSSCKLGALDFINDYKFLLPAERLAQKFRAVGKPTFRYLVDEPNPWQTSNGSHHAVDLIFLFGGFDLSFAPAALRTGEQMREAWVHFVYSEVLWVGASYAAFGPYGMFQELDDSEVRSRRRMTQVEYLEGIDSEVLDKVLFSLAAGRISLLN